MLIEVVRQGTTLVKHLLALLLHVAVVLLDVVDERVDEFQLVLEAEHDDWLLLVGVAAGLLVLLFAIFVQVVVLVVEALVEVECVALIDVDDRYDGGSYADRLHHTLQFHDIQQTLEQVLEADILPEGLRKHVLERL